MDRELSDVGGSGADPPPLGDNSDPDLSGTLGSIGIVVFVLVAVFCCLCLRKFNKGRRQDDEEQLDPQEPQESWLSLFSCCSETSDTVSVEGNRLGPVYSISAEPIAPRPLAPQNSSRHQQQEECQDFKKALRHLQQQILVDSKEESVKTIRLVQQLMLERGITPTESSLQTCLVIGVDARPTVLGGYCVNLREMTIEYYAIKMEDFPLTMENPGDPDEFEMKNLQFALALWGKTIRKYKTFRVYTDNYAIEKEDSEFGVDAMDLLEHLTNCEDAKQINEQEHVHKKQKMEHFAIYIQPADDFTRWEIDKGTEFLCKYYGIDTKRVQGTMKLTRERTPDTKPWYDPNGNCNHYIQRAKTFARNFKCETCVIDAFYDMSSRDGSARNATASNRSHSRSRSRSGQNQSRHNGNEVDYVSGNRKQKQRHRRRRRNNAQNQQENRFKNFLRSNMWF